MVGNGWAGCDSPWVVVVVGDDNIVMVGSLALLVGPRKKK
jgi:hypothetical protein